MIIKITGPMTLEGYMNVLKQVIGEHLEDDHYIQSPSLYLNFRHNETHAIKDILDEEGEPLVVSLYSFSDLENKVIELLKNDVRNKDIAIALGINASTVSNIKRKAIDFGLYSPATPIAKTKKLK